MNIDRLQYNTITEHYINTLLELEMSINSLTLSISGQYNYDNINNINNNINNTDIESMIDSINIFTNSLQTYTTRLSTSINNNNEDYDNNYNNVNIQHNDNILETNLTYNSNDYGYLELIRNISIYDKKYFTLIRHKEKNECNICYSKKKLFTKLNNCKHSFCNLCVKNWIKTNYTCPMCRTSIVTLNIYNESTSNNNSIYINSSTSNNIVDNSNNIYTLNTINIEE